MNISRISEMCWDHHITIAALEREAGLSNGAISKWKKVSPRLDSIKKIAEYFGCGIDDLLADDSEEADDAEAETDDAGV